MPKAFSVGRAQKRSLLKHKHVNCRRARVCIIGALVRSFWAQHGVFGMWFPFGAGQGVANFFSVSSVIVVGLTCVVLTGLLTNLFVACNGKIVLGTLLLVGHLCLPFLCWHFSLLHVSSCSFAALSLFIPKFRATCSFLLNKLNLDLVLASDWSELQMARPRR